MTRLTAAIAAIALASGCSKGVANDFSSVLPDDRVKINMPIDDAGGLRSNVGDTAEYYQFTAQVTTDVNALIGTVLDGVAYIADFEPTASDDSTSVWGPWEDDGIEGYMAMNYEEAEDTYTWALEFRNAGETDDDWVTVYVGNIEEGATDEVSAGQFAIDFDAFSEFAVEDGDELTGTFYVEYDVNEATTSAYVGFEDFSENGSETTDIGYFYDQEHDEGGMMDLVFWADITENEVQEAHIVRTRWHKEGDGRSDVYITDGDFGPLVYQATECWKRDHAVTFYEDNANFVSDGDEGMCTFGEPDWNDSEDAPAAG